MNFLKKNIGYVFIVVLLIAWELSALYINSPYFPPLSKTIKSIFSSIQNERFLFYAFSSVYHSLIAIFIATLITVPLGLMIGRNRFLYNLFMPLINLLRPLPSSAIIPMAIIFLGIGLEMKLFVIIFGCSWPILINTIDGALGIEPMFLRTSKILGLSKLYRLKNVIIPATLPAIFTGLRISIAISFILTITVEMIVGTDGIGYFIIDKERSFKFPEMYGGILCLGIIGIFINNGFNFLDQKINKWYYESK